MDNKNSFSYTYSAKDREELMQIRNKYSAPEESPMDRLRRLDGAVTKKASVIALILGIIGTLIMGFGMSSVMADISLIPGISHSIETLLGIVIGIVGMVILALAYPIYRLTLKKGRQRIAPEVLRLTDELLK